ncbi:hypothetical protein PP707_00070 [Acetobacter pasteurianus]|nr:hypothetical protein [Acetobacter pasteurianus]
MPKSKTSNKDGPTKGSSNSNKGGNSAGFDSSLKLRANKKNQVFKALLDNPFTQSNIWPFVEPQVATDTLDLFEALIGPLFESLRSSTSKNGPAFAVKGISLGFNSTVGKLEAQAANNRGKHKDSRDQIKCLLVCKYDITPPLLTSMLPVLCFTASKSSQDRVKLVQLPRGSMQRLSQITGTPNTGIVGISTEVKEAHNLIEYIEKQVADVEAPWLNQIFDSPHLFFPPKVAQVATTRGARKKKEKKNKKGETKEERVRSGVGVGDDIDTEDNEHTTVKQNLKGSTNTQPGSAQVLAAKEPKDDLAMDVTIGDVN